MYSSGCLRSCRRSVWKANGLTSVRLAAAVVAARACGDGGGGGRGGAGAERRVAGAERRGAPTHEAQLELTSMVTATSQAAAPTWATYFRQISETAQPYSAPFRV